MHDINWIDYSYDESLPYTADDFHFVDGKRYYDPDHPPRHMTSEEREAQVARLREWLRAWNS